MCGVMGGAAEVYLRYVRRYFTKRRVSGVLKSPFSAAGIWSLTVLAPHITQIDLRGLEITPHISEIHAFIGKSIKNRNTTTLLSAESAIYSSPTGA